MVYKKITTSNKIGYALCKNSCYAAYMILGCWFIPTVLAWALLSLYMGSNQDWVIVAGVVIHGTIGAWSLFQYDDYSEKESHNKKLEDDIQLNLFRDFGIEYSNRKKGWNNGI